MTFELYTEDRLQYNFYPVTSNTLSFRIKAPHDAHIILTENQYDSTPCYEIFFGGWKNTKSVIRKNKVQPDVVEIATPNILNANEYKGFWIHWEYGAITAGIAGDLNPILRYQDPQLFPIRFFGVCTGWGARGHWIIDNTPPSVPYGVPPAGGYVPPAAMSYPQPSYNPAFAPPAVGIPPTYPSGIGFATPTTAPKWLPSSNGLVPPNAVVGGNDLSGEPIYIIRARHEGSLTPGKLVPSHRIAYIPWGGRENPKDDYEVLCDCTPRWVNVTAGQVPPGAFVAGQSEAGEILYVGRAHHNGSLTIGKVQASHGACYIPFGGEEIAKHEYEILVI